MQNDNIIYICLDNINVYIYNNNNNNNNKYIINIMIINIDICRYAVVILMNICILMKTGY